MVALVESFEKPAECARTNIELNTAKSVEAAALDAKDMRILDVGDSGELWR
jgi:hypothetical protein